MTIGQPPPMEPWQAAEVAARDWLRAHGYPAAELTAPGADFGVDVEAPGLVAQVKAWGDRVGRPEVQQLYGVSMAKRSKAVFFSISGYKAPAVEWATEHGVALLRLMPDGGAAPVNDQGTALARASSPLVLPQSHRARVKALEKLARQAEEAEKARLEELEKRTLALLPHLTRLASKMVVRPAVALLAPGEFPEAAAVWARGKGLVLLTSGRILSVEVGAGKGVFHTDTWFRSQINRLVPASKGTALELHIGVEARVFDRMRTGDVTRFLEAFNPTTTPSGSSSGLASEPQTPSSPARWAPDPSGRHEYRYWDGNEWTGDVSDGGHTSHDPLPTDGSGE